MRSREDGGGVVGVSDVDQLHFGVTVQVVDGDLLEQADVDALVNPWNRNLWALQSVIRSTGVSGALKKRTGPGPWRQLRSAGMLPVGGAVVTDAGDLRAGQLLVHVAGLHLTWRASERSVTSATVNAVAAAWAAGARSLAMPLIGTGQGGLGEEKVLRLQQDALQAASEPGSTDTLAVRIVRYPGRRR